MASSAFCFVGVSMRRIAVTGGIAEGKSTVLGYLRDAGHAVVSADVVAREVFASERVQQWLRRTFGEEAEPSREAVRARLSKDFTFRRALNERMHPEILRRLVASEAAFVEIPLLFETCSQRTFDRVWVVTCGPEEQLRRLESRLGDAAKAAELLGTQLPTRAKCALADRIVRTNAPEDAVQRKSVEAAIVDVG